MGAASNTTDRSQRCSVRNLTSLRALSLEIPSLVKMILLIDAVAHSGIASIIASLTEYLLLYLSL